jgi:hypothetical protein
VSQEIIDSNIEIKTKSVRWATRSTVFEPEQYSPIYQSSSFIYTPKEALLIIVQVPENRSQTTILSQLLDGDAQQRVHSLDIIV